MKQARRRNVALFVIVVLMLMFTVAFNDVHWPGAISVYIALVVAAGGLINNLA